MPIKVDPAKLDHAVQRYAAGEPLAHICQDMRLDFYTLKRTLAQRGVPIRSKGEATRLAKVGPIDTSDAVCRYMAGETMAELAARYRMSNQAVRALIVNQGGTIKHGRESRQRPAWETEAVTLYQQGQSLTELSKRLGASSQTIKRILQDNGVQVLDFVAAATRAIRQKPVDWHQAKTSKMRQTRMAAAGLPNDEIVSRYQAGESENEIAQALNTSRTAIRRRLQDAGVPIRTMTEANRLMAAKRTPEENERIMEAARKATRGRKMTMAEKCKRAQIREQLAQHRSPAEVLLEGWLAERGVPTIPQQAVGPYSVDLGAYPIAVEVYGGTWHLQRDDAERSRYLFDAGWHLVIVFVDGRRSILTEGAADYIASFYQTAAANPTMGREYRVIWGEGKLFAAGGPDGYKFANVVPRRRG